MNNSRWSKTWLISSKPRQKDHKNVDTLAIRKQMHYDLIFWIAGAREEENYLAAFLLESRWHLF